MQVYLEYAILDNLIINFILLKTTCNLVKIKTSFLMLFISSAVGTIVAILLPLFDLIAFYNVIVKLVLALLMPYLLTKYFSVKKYFITVFVFLTLTFLTGGVIFAIMYFADLSFEWEYPIVPIGITFLLVYFVSKLTIKCTKILYKKRDIHPFLKKCILVINGVKIKVNGFIDSGNHLYDEKSGLPIVVANNNIYQKIKNGKNLKYHSSINIDTVSGSGKLDLYIIDKLLIYNGDSVNIFNSVLIGFSSANFFSSDYELLLHPSLF